MKECCNFHVWTGVYDLQKFSALIGIVLMGLLYTDEKRIISAVYFVNIIDLVLV